MSKPNLPPNLPPYWKEFDSFTILHIGTKYGVAAFEKDDCLCNSICVPYRGYVLSVKPATRFDDPATRIIAAMDKMDAEIAAKAVEAPAKAAEAPVNVVNSIPTEHDLYAD